MLTNKQICNIEERLLDQMNYNELYEALTKAIGVHKLEEYLIFIARVYDIDITDITAGE